jgi:hypothetical protein
LYDLIGGENNTLPVSHPASAQSYPQLLGKSYFSAVTGCKLGAKFGMMIAFKGQ